MIVFSFPIHRQLLIQRLTGTIPSIAIRRTRVVLPAWRGPATKTTDVSATASAMRIAISRW
ncbi:MAG: hypothetical protein JZU70_05650 [Chlorobium sp.]|nr:hypothetical protein [Chlorobium sp.]